MKERKVKMGFKNNTQNQFILTKAMVFVMAAAAGIVVANLYYGQPLLSKIARSFHVTEGEVGVVAMLTQIGYAMGMFFLLPLGDIKERRMLIIFMLYVCSMAMLLMAASFNIPMLLIAASSVGFTSVVPQLMVPLAAQLAPAKERGRIIGTVMSGLLIGILLSRTFSGIIGGIFGWRVVYFAGAILMLLLAILLKRLLPETLPSSRIKYTELIKSIWEVFRTEPVLRESSINGALMFAAFSAFWTSLVFLMESPTYNMGAKAAGTLGLIGVGGALAAPVIGRIADKKSPRFMVGVAIMISTAAYICFWTLGFKFWGLIIGISLLDLGTQSGQISNQARILCLSEEKRNRINTIFMVSYFLGGSMGSILGATSWARFGWNGVCGVGFSFLALAAVFHLIPRKRK